MAGSQVTTSVSIISSLLGFQAISLTEMESTTVPAIAAGSKVEISGAFFTFGTAESINATSWTAITTANAAYIILTPAGTAGSQTVTAAWTVTAPVWSTAKQGWYASAASTVRYVAGCLKYSSVSYYQKFILGDEQRPLMPLLYRDATTADTIKTVAKTVIEIGDWNMDSTSSLSVTHALGSGLTAIIGAQAFVRPDSGLGPEDIYPINYVATGASALAGGIALINNNAIVLTRATGGIFDSASFDATSYNRGWVVVDFML